MKRFLKEYFTFSRSESKVVLILSCLIFISLLIRQFGFPEIIAEKPAPVSSLEEAENFIKSLEAAAGEVEAFRRVPGRKSAVAHKINPVIFDPNVAGEEDFRAIGLSGFVIRNILKYREKGGRFTTAEDFSKIYGLEKDDFGILESFIRIEAAVDDKHIDLAVPEVRAKIPFHIEINSAGPAEFEKIRGIGKVRSGTIIRYRQLLGGFVSPGQLVEVYGITDSLLDANAFHFTADTAMIRKISLNEADYAAFLRHPYLNKPAVKAIIKYRQFSKDSITVSGLRKDEVIPDSVFQRIAPYLDK